ncbi:MAG: hypothetical protein AAF244_00320 [Pseudomonadota bacterium]
MTIVLSNIDVGNIVKPAGEQGWVYVFAIGRDASGDISEYATYRIVEENETISGTNALPIQKDSITSGDLSRLGLTSPTVEIRNNRIRTIKATDDTYYVQEIAAQTSDAFQKIADNIHHEIGANDEKYGASKSSAVMPYDNITGPVVGESRGNSDDTQNRGLTKTKRLKKATSLVNVRDMYLDHAADYGLISRETLALLSPQFSTLQEAWEATKTDDITTPQQAAKTFKQAFPDAKKYVKNADKIWPASKPREDLVIEDPVYQVADKYKYCLDDAAKLGLISQKTADILWNQPDDADCRPIMYVEEAFRLVGAHQYFVSEYTNPNTQEPITKEEVREIIRDIESLYNALSAGIAAKTDIDENKIETIKNDLSSARKAFFSRDDIKTSVFTHHDFTRAVVPKLEGQVKAQKTSVEERDYTALGITPPNQG